MDKITVRAYKYGHVLHWESEAPLYAKAGNYLVVKYEANRRFYHYTRGKNITMRWPGFEFFPLDGSLDSWYTAYIEKTSQGLCRYYCNINLPPAFDGERLDFVDLDLDIVNNGEGFITVDQEELGDNAHKYGYPPGLVEKAWEAERNLRKRIEGKEFPFDGFLLDLVKTI